MSRRWTSTRRCRASCDALKVKYQLGAVLRLPNETVGALTMLRSEAEGHASEACIAAFGRLAPHIEQACALGHVLEQRTATQAILLDALARKADGVILLGSGGMPTFMNDAAQALLADGDGLAFRAGTFAASRGPETRRLQAMIRDAIAASAGSRVRPGGQMLVTRPSGKRPVIIRAIPAPPAERFLSGESIRCVLYLHDLAAVRLPSKTTLCSVFGLTEREADLSVELARRVNLAAAAAGAGMSLNTARNHLQSVFRKCGVSSQSEAMQLFGHLA